MLTCQYSTDTNNPDLERYKIQGFKVKNLVQQVQHVAYSGYSISVSRLNEQMRDEDLFTELSSTCEGYGEA